MKVQITRDTPTWIRETFEIEVPEGLEGDDLTEAIVETCIYDDYVPSSHATEVMGRVAFMDPTIEATLPNGEEIKL